ncbi:SDR family NAD(P)-dependent oxidoreductase, partial [Acinetobacter baumannii]|uniref:SDR family NAD(P)-dependent oxidoreductase n=1 Tax=Acinetobacter baumannii TaxID=470 RepID=UPI00163BA56D
MTQRIALVTGGSRGLGKNAALKLAAKGTDILLTYHSNRQAALDVVAEIEKKGVKAAALAMNAVASKTYDAVDSEVA